MMMGEAQATLKDGRTLTLFAGFRALAFAAAQTGIPATEIFKVLQKDDGRQSLAVLALIEGALQRYHRDIGADEIDGLMLTDGEALSEAISSALNSAFSDDEPDQADEGNAPPVGTSTRSKPTGRKRA